MKTTFSAFVLILTLGLTLTGCSSQNPSSTSTQNQTGDVQQQSSGPDYQNISSETLNKMMSTDKDLVVVDVREKVEWDDGHIAGTKLIPMSEFQSRANELPKDKKIVIICASGSRSPQVAAYMAQLGYTQIYNLNRGIMDWPYELVR